LSDERAIELRQRMEAGEKKASLARAFGISRVTVDKYLAA
jgi:response regulator of citrate/malate metabolism